MRVNNPVERKRKIKELQGKRSKELGRENQLLIFNALMKKGSQSFSELLEEMECSAPVLAKHLKALQIDGTIEKVVVKPNDKKSNLEDVGKTVYQLGPEDAIEMFEREMVQMSSIVPYLGALPDGLRKKIQEQYDAIVKVWSDFGKEQYALWHPKGLKRQTLRLTEDGALVEE